MQRIDVSKEFSEVVKGVDGKVLDEELPNVRGFSNADYWFPKDNVVGELKCLQENFLYKEDFTKKIVALYESWIADGRVKPSKTGRIRIDLRNIPESCALEFLELLKKRLEYSVIKKANKQIRETVQYLALSNAKGILFLANDGNLAMKPDMTTRLIYRILRGKYKAISSVVYFSVNDLSAMPGVAMSGTFWIDGVMDDREPASKSFREKVGRAWFKHRSDFSPGTLLVKMRNEPIVLENVQFLDWPYKITNTDKNT